MDLVYESVIYDQFIAIVLGHMRMEKLQTWESPAGFHITTFWKCLESISLENSTYNGIKLGNPSICPYFLLRKTCDISNMTWSCSPMGEESWFPMVSYFHVTYQYISYISKVVSPTDPFPRSRTTLFLRQCVSAASLLGGWSSFRIHKDHP